MLHMVVSDGQQNYWFFATKYLQEIVTFSNNCAKYVLILVPYGCQWLIIDRPIENGLSVVPTLENNSLL